MMLIYDKDTILTKYKMDKLSELAKYFKQG